MRKSNRKINTIIIITVALFLLSSAVLAESYIKQNVTTNNEPIKIAQINTSQKEPQAMKMSEDDIANALAAQYGKSRKEIFDLKAKFKDWAKVQGELEKFEQSLVLTQEKIIYLINHGYKLQDIDKAGELAITYGIPPEEILVMKKNTNAAWKDTKNTKEISWDEVKLELDVEKSIRLSDIKTKEADKIRKDSLKQFSLDNSTKNKTKNEINEKLFAKNKVTDKDKALCKKYGLDNNSDILFCKCLSNYYKKDLLQILELKKAKGDWNEVKNELEVGKNEN